MKKQQDPVAAETVQITSDQAVAPAATCSGFAVVLRYGGNRYTSVYNPDAARGIRADEVWIFGSPQIRHERAIWEVVAPMLSWVQEAMIHRIPNASSATAQSD